MDTDEIKDEMVCDPNPVAPSRTGRQWCFLVLKIIASTVVGVVLMLFLLSLYLFSGRGGHAYRSEAIMNAKQIGMTLFVFDQDYKSYPNDKTGRSITLAKDKGVFDLGWPGSSNYYFRQLIVTGFLDQENPFHAQQQNEKRPDNVMDGSNLLEAGECGFSYVVWESSENLHEKAPLIITPLIPGKRQFDYEYAKEYFGKKIVILYRDNSVGVYPVDESGRVMIDGKDFFDPSQPYWSGQKPRIAWPE